MQWIKYYRACSNIKLGEYNEGERDFLALQGQIRDINFYEVLYQTYSSLNQDLKANTFLIYDIYMSGYDITKVNLFENLLNASKKINYTKLTELIEVMLYKIKVETNQNVEAIEDPYPTEDSGDLYDRMMDELTDHLDKFIERHQGKVMYYKKDKEIANILTSQEEMLFFRQADYIYDEEVKRFDVVEYSILPTYDRKKDCETNKAVLITLLYEDIRY